MRPRQWLKNFFVFAGLLFTLDLGHSATSYVRVALAFLLFCVLSGSVYLLNDILDAERDRKHEKKSKRPIASGRLTETAAWGSVLVLMGAGMAGSLALDFTFGGIALIYLALFTAYSLFLKEVVILDVLIIASGFVLRAAAGVAVIHVTISPWLLICTTLLALLLGLAKRREELLILDVEAVKHRPALEQYSVAFLDQLINVSASAAIIAYALYTFFSQTGEAHPYMMATLPFVIYGIFRYLFLIHNRRGVDSPELLVLADKPLLVDVLLWVAVSALIVGLGS